MTWTRGWRLRLMAAGMLAYPVVTAVGITRPFGYVVVAAFACCYVVYAAGVWRPFLLAVMAALVVAALPFAHDDAFFLAAVVVSFAASRLRRYAAVLVSATAVASVVVPWVMGYGAGWIQAITIVFTALTVIGYGEIVAANVALVEARAEVARLASEGERARIARDLHDLLGHSLTAITVKSDLARRLDGSAARREIAELELLRASGVEAEVPTAIGALGADAQELFGWAVREGVTNVVRHARATRCVVTVSANGVEIYDDGVGGGRDEVGGHGGNGGSGGVGGPSGIGGSIRWGAGG